MGIKGLFKLVGDVAPAAIKEVELKSYFGRRIAIDASMSLYQFLFAIRFSENLMTNEHGETTSHIVGFFYRTCKLLEVGIRPIYVFDGKPPVLKGGTLDKRKTAREDAQKKLVEAKETANQEDVEKYTKRLVRVTRKHNDDVKTLLKLMGLPVIEAPSEAEAMCAQLSKEGLVYGVATEDMDALTFGAQKVIRGLSSSNQDKVKEVDLTKMLEGFQLNHQQFIDLCILMGCDYCDSIRGIGPKKGLDLVKKHTTIENILQDKYGISDVVDDVEVVYSDRRERIEETQVKEEVEEMMEEKTNGSSEVKKETNENGSSFQEIKDKINDKVMKEVDCLFAETKTEDHEGDSFEEVTHDDTKTSFDEDSKDGNEEQEETDDDEKPDKKSKDKKKTVKRDIKQDVPENWLFKGARKLFIEANVSVGKYSESDLKISDPDEEGVIQFLVGQHAFSEERVKAALKRVKEYKKKSNQSRIDTFFKVLPKESPSNATKRPPPKGSSTAAKGTAAKKGRKPK